MTFAAFTFPLKVQFTASVSGALLLLVLRDGSSFLLSLVLWWVYRWAFPRFRPTTLSILGAALSVLGAAVQCVFFLVVHRVFPYHDDLLFTEPFVFDVFYERAGLLFGWSALYFGIRQMRDGMKRELRMARMESEKRRAELQMLRSQMNPHFLFNALTAIQSGLVGREPELAAVVQNLSDYLRFSLQHAGASMVPIGAEFDAMEDYLRVEKARFGEELEFECRIEDLIRDVPAPGILLQPLVENAVKYGRRTSTTRLHITVEVSANGGQNLILRVMNTGRWQKPRQDSTRIGLRNLERRLALIYPNRYRFKTEEREGRVIITVQIPQQP